MLPCNELSQCLSSYFKIIIVFIILLLFLVFINENVMYQAFDDFLADYETVPYNLLL
jgi:uncharacterized integral membrane protein